MEERHKVFIPEPPEPPKHLKGEERERWIYLEPAPADVRAQRRARASSQER